MSKASRRAIDEQFDLFLPYLADLPLRDQREMMERPFFSLAKTKRLKPIDYTSPDGKLWVNVSTNPQYGMATIWDADILIYCASVLSDMQRRGINEIPRTLHIMPYDLLRAIGRPTTGRAYELLGQALDRLVATTVKTNIRAESRREATFSWLDGWTQLVDERTERSRGMTLELSNWFWEGVLMKGGVLAIDRAYFDITGGRERWLYRVARKHAGGAGEAGFAISMPTLFEKSGAEGPYRRFKFEIIKITEKNGLPGYHLAIEETEGRKEPMLRMRREDAPAVRRKDDAHSPQPTAAPNVSLRKLCVEKSSATKPGEEGLATGKPVAENVTADNRHTGAFGAAKTAKAAAAAPLSDALDVSKLIRGAVAGLSDKATRGYMTDETLDLLRQECPGWDLYTLHTEFERWVGGDPGRTPANWQKAFIGYVRRWHEKHKHELRG